jgi:hypothetical protein
MYFKMIYFWRSEEDENLDSVRTKAVISEKKGQVQNSGRKRVRC